MPLWPFSSSLVRKRSIWVVGAGGGVLSLSANWIELGFDSIADNDGCCCSLLKGITTVHLATYSASLTRCPAGSLSPKNILVIKNDRAKIPKNNRTISVNNSWRGFPCMGRISSRMVLNNSCEMTRRNFFNLGGPGGPKTFLQGSVWALGWCSLGRPSGPENFPHGSFWVLGCFGVG